MTLGEFLKVTGGEYVKVLVGNVNILAIDGDKNAIRMYKPELLEREVCNVGIATKNRFEVLIK
jgi:hypothetical protein